LEELLGNDGKGKVENSAQKANNMSSGYSQLVMENGEMRIVFKQEGGIPEGDKLK
jgi:hypothetical protein